MQLLKNIKWTTFDGRTTNMAEIDHQHLSNIYWYHKTLFNKEFNVLQLVFDARFSGTILPYKPYSKFKQEISELDKRGMLQKKSFFKNDIIFEGKIIGEYIDNSFDYN